MTLPHSCRIRNGVYYCYNVGLFSAEHQDRQSNNKGSVLDVVSAIPGHSSSNASVTFKRLCNHYPELNTRSIQLRINGSGRETPVADSATLIEIAYVLPGRLAAAFRRAGADLVRRALGGDLSLIDEIERRHRNLARTAEQQFLCGATESQAVEISSKAIFWDPEKFDRCKGEVRGTMGSVYIVTSPLVGVAKIGFWKGTLSALRSRYVVYYGQEIRLWAFAAEDCRMAEAACHTALAPYRLSNELFRGESINHYV